MRPNKKHLKFPLYLDEQIGFGQQSSASIIQSDTEEVSAVINLHDAVSLYIKFDLNVQAFICFI